MKIQRVDVDTVVIGGGFDKVNSMVPTLNIGGFQMSELEQLEQQVLQLSPDDLAKFRAWFIELDYQFWDKQIEADVAAGKLDRLIADARAEFKAGKAREL